MNQGNVFFIGGRIQAFTHVIVQPNRINWFICDNISNFFWFNNFSNNVQKFLPTPTHRHKENFLIWFIYSTINEVQAFIVLA